MRESQKPESKQGETSLFCPGQLQNLKQSLVLATIQGLGIIHSAYPSSDSSKTICEPELKAMNNIIMLGPCYSTSGN